MSRYVVCWSTVLAACLACAQEDPQSAAVPKNIIVMIADGWGYNHILATNYYETGEAGTAVYEREFAHYPMSTYSAGVQGYNAQRAWTDFKYVASAATDSAAAATAMSTGVKTRNGAIGVDAEGKPLEHAIDVAERFGKATGVVTSVQLSHATPAAFVAHDRSRGKYEELAKEMLLQSAVDVIMGAGHPWYGNEGEFVLTKDASGKESTPNSYRFVGDEPTWRSVVEGKAGADADGDGVADPWTLVQTKDEFEKLRSGDAPKRVLGVLTVHETLQQSRKGVDDNQKDDLPFQTPLLTTVPTLAQMTLGALNVLDNDPDGFFLMIEGGAVDWASHANEGGRMIEEMMDYNRAVEAVVDWVKTNSSWEETLVIVTGDHECGYLLGPGSNPEHKEIVNNGKGVMPGLEWQKTSHTNSLVPCYIKGAGAERFKDCIKGEDPKRGKYIDNADIGLVVKSLLRQ